MRGPRSGRSRSLKVEPEAQTAAAQTEADHLKRDNDLNEAVASRSEPFKRKNDAKMVAAQTEAERLKHDNEASGRRR